jgi:hypothetical protein
MGLAVQRPRTRALARRERNHDCLAMLKRPTARLPDGVKRRTRNEGDGSDVRLRVPQGARTTATPAAIINGGAPAQRIAVVVKMMLMMA